MFKRFQDRVEAGEALAKALTAYKARPDVLLFALPRGGVPVAHEVAKALSLPLDIWLVRKLGMPGQEEFAMGAIAMGGVRYINPEYVEMGGIGKKSLDQVIAKEEAELQRRNALYRHGLPVPQVKGKTIIVVDDGLATGATMRAAVESLRQLQAERIIVAVPVGSASACAALSSIADDVVCLHMPEPFYGVGQWYMDFSQTSDDEVQEILGHYGKNKLS
ncbi:MAG: phosphoribosyltransferase [Alphaproteobacteria bacterium]|nr:phosphoribosyltransferase [Alphaproteobacteria bacterium]